MSQAKFNDDIFLAKWLNGELSEAELLEFKQSDDYELFKKIADKSQELNVPYWDKDKVLKEVLESEKQIRHLTRTSPVRRYLWPAAIAASLLLVLSYIFLIRPNAQLVSYQTLAAQKLEIELPDGSMAFLNASTSLEYNEESFIEDRQLRISGEAYFEVKKGSSFIVNSQNGSVKVLGTTFNVFDRDALYEVHCFSGKVSVLYDDKNPEMTLIKGDRVKVENDILVERSSNEVYDGLPDWKQGQSRFMNSSFLEVVSELERQFSIELILPPELKTLEDYNGGFAHDDLTKALDIISSSVSYDYKIEGNTVTLVKR